MISDQLFKAALAYKREKLWRKLYDTQLFAVRHSDGTIGYCCVMGAMGELNAFAVYPDQAGLDSLRRMNDANAASSDFLSMNECMRAQYCAMVSFEGKDDLMPRDLEEAYDYARRAGIAFRGRNAFPHFEMFRPMRERWYIEDEADQVHLREGLEAAVEVARRLNDERKVPEELGLFEGGFCDRAIPLLVRGAAGYVWTTHELPARRMFAYPALRFGDDLTRARIRKAKKRGEWAARVFVATAPVAHGAGDGQIPFEELTEAPYFPLVLMIVSVATGEVLAVDMAEEDENCGAHFGNVVAELAASRGLPVRLLVEDARTEAMFRDFCAECGVGLTALEDIEPLDSAIEGLLDHMDPEDPELEMMFDVLRDEELLRSVPDEMLSDLLGKIGPEDLPEDVAQLLYSEAGRRGLL